MLRRGLAYIYICKCKELTDRAYYRKTSRDRPLSADLPACISLKLQRERSCTARVPNGIQDRNRRFGISTEVNVTVALYRYTPSE